MTKTFELTVSKIEDLFHKLDNIPSEAKLHLPDKPNIHPNIELIKYLKTRNLGITFSVINHYHNGNLDLILDDFKQYLDILQTSENITELLIVSGPNQRKINTLVILKHLSNSNLRFILKPNLIISVAYNCNSSDQTLENQRLKQKLECHLVQKVYLQITDNLEKILTGINYIRESNPNLKICICIFEPTKLSLSKFKLRPWKGVVLSELFLSNVQTAKLINQNNLIELDKWNIEIIIT